jgi:hypothetical protein
VHVPQVETVVPVPLDVSTVSFVPQGA